ncbi:MAG TPA: hypothetical protein VH083_22410 [Myxococcales bacterium]|jgi:hypothetical protein|nr:hypothetical protein [Myxococcales bacterium]
MKDRLLLSILLGGLAMLVVELRFEHREALGETWHAWIPLAYAAATLLAGAVTLLVWSPGWRRALAVLFAAGVAVGLGGLWFHSGGHPIHNVLGVLAVWRLPPGQVGAIKIGSQPPALAPLAFCGLGTLGLLACYKAG